MGLWGCVIKRLAVGPGDPWPEAVSDGLTLPCVSCGTEPLLDYHVTENEWRRVIPKDWQRWVVCLDCFIDAGGRLAEVEEIQVTVGSETLVLLPSLLVEYGMRGG